MRERPVQPATAVAGEVALSGRLRAAVRAERRLLEATRLGFARVITGPGRSSGEGQAKGLVVARDIGEALRLSLEA
jgi:predicted ATP-dependent serine protease